jgi:hypothetical protein
MNKCERSNQFLQKKTARNKELLQLKYHTQIWLKPKKKKKKKIKKKTNKTNETKEGFNPLFLMVRRMEITTIKGQK